MASGECAYCGKESSWLRTCSCNGCGKLYCGDCCGFDTCCRECAYDDDD